MKKNILNSLEEELLRLEDQSNLRTLPDILHYNRDVIVGDTTMLNLSSNDYLGLATDIKLRKEFLKELDPETFLPSSSSSRLLTGNFSIYAEVEKQLCNLFNAEAALIFNSGYHMNTGILPAISDVNTLILADKLVHASIIDGIRLSAAKCIRYRHNNYQQLEFLLNNYCKSYNKVIIVTESIFSMDGDEADLQKLVELKKQFGNVLLYVDEAHAIGVRGNNGLGCAEEKECISDIDFLTGTFGKALASLGGYIVCRKTIRDYLVNKMRTLIFTTALPPVNLMWTKFILDRLPDFKDKREALKQTSILLKEGLVLKGYQCVSGSHIIPVMTGNSHITVEKAKEIQKKGFYVLPVRPPTVPEGTSRLRISLTASIKQEEIEQLINIL